MNLSELVVDTKYVEIDFPGLEGFKVTLSHVTRETSRKLKDECTVSKIDPKYRTQVEELDQDKFMTAFIKIAIKSWTGLKYKYLEDLMLVDLSKVEDREEEVDFNYDNADVLVKGSTTFDNWLNEVVFSLELFRD
jgi:hypothetical protein